MALIDKVAYITGGSKGIGLGIAEAMVRAGMKVGITSRTASEVKDAADHLNQIQSDSAIGVVADVREAAAQEAAVKEILNKWGKIDVVIANAGIGHFASIEEMTAEQWNQTIDINLTGVFHTVKSTIEALKSTKGYLITIASLAGTNFFAKGAAYNASKFGLVGFTQAVMLDLRQHGIRVSTMMPGSVSTYFNGHQPSEKDAWKIQPEDLGEMVVDLLRVNPRTLPSKIEIRPSIPPKR